jgi:Double zinc ribbon
MNDLVACPCCGHQVSRKAKYCPSCGHPLPALYAARRDGCLAIVGLVIVLLGLAVIATRALAPAMDPFRAPEGSTAPTLH